MKRQGLLYAFVLAIVLLPFDALCASFTAKAPSQVIQGSKFSITYTLENATGTDFQSPNVGGCQKLYGPAISESVGMVNINGKVSRNSAVSYTMTYVAEKAGTYQVGAASVNVGGKVYKTKPFSIQILPQDKSVNARNQQTHRVQIDDVTTQTPDKAIGKNDVFVRIVLSKPQAYEQEGIMCTIKLYTKYDIQQFMPTLQPSFNGFISQEIPISAGINQLENYNGENYRVATLKQCILFPQQSGKLTITSGNYDLTVIQYELVRSMFGMIRRPVEKQIKVKSNSASVEILPLPQPQPADFSGAVGKFTVSTELLNSNLKTNEAGTLRLTVKGTGNLKNVKTPSLDFPSQFDVYDPQTTVDAKPAGNMLTGNVVIDYVFVPQFVGTFTIPESSFSFFDPETGKYEQIKLNGYNLNIAKGTAAVSAPVEDDAKMKDIRHITTGDLSLEKANSMLVYRGGYVLWYLIPVGLFGVLLFYYRKAIKARANVALMKTKRANKVANKRLKAARLLMVKQQRDSFYEELLRALWGYLSDKLVIPVSQLNRDNISVELTNYGITEELNAQILDMLDKCEFARYAKPDENNNDMTEIYRTACDSINRIENAKKK